MKKFVIAEISGNHCKSKKILKETIIGCSKAGADAIKMQFYKAGDLVNKFDNKKYKSGIWRGKTPYQILKKSETSLDLVKYGVYLAKKNNLKFLCSVFEPKDFSKLKKLGIKNFKIASLEANYINLIKEIKKNKNNFFISLGAINLKEFKQYKKYFDLSKNIFFYCKIKYPSQISDYNLKDISKLKKYLKNIGISDHTKSLKMGNYAKQYGANYFEKHVKLNSKIKSEDAKFSITVKELERYINYINQKDIKFKNEIKKNIKREIYKTRKIFAVRYLKKNSIIKKENLGFFRSTLGIETKDMNKILGKKTTSEIKKGEKINFNQIII